ncbi:Protein of unknown function [Bacillus thuringiensis]|uniref:Uncharacterized protein n=1 Tax=Bacillus thuringiensis TaxID=1428 RepID=A0A1C4F3H3_BACTU|nr:Protein of unknown function [Bacillus thuringiensis]
MSALIVSIPCINQFIEQGDK